MENEQVAACMQHELLPPEDFVTLLDKLYDLLADAHDAPHVQEKTLHLIRWVEGFIPPVSVEGQHELMLGGSK